MTKTLTEQWRDGILQEGYYYINSKKWGMLIDRYRDQINDCGNKWRGFDNYQGVVDEVLAPVPSYDEYNELKQDNKYLKSGIETRDEQIERLEKRLEIATKALKDIVRDYEINGSCEEDCVGEYMCHTAQQALTKMEGVK